MVTAFGKLTVKKYLYKQKRSTPTPPSYTKSVPFLLGTPTLTKYLFLMYIFFFFLFKSKKIDLSVLRYACLYK